MTRPTKAEAFARAGEAFAAALLQLEELPPAESARRAWTPTGPSVEELEDQIRARRGLPARAAS